MTGGYNAKLVSPEVVFVTGATAGFGAEIARRFASLGSRLIIAGRRKDRLDRLGIPHPAFVES